MAEDKMGKLWAGGEVLERPCEACSDHTDQRVSGRYVCRMCYDGEDDARRMAIDAYCQGEGDYADLPLPEYLDRLFEEK